MAKADAQEAEADGLEDFEELCEDEEEMNEQSNASEGQLSTLLEAIQDVAAQTLEFQLHRTRLLNQKFSLETRMNPCLMVRICHF